ncbi:MAG: tRNA ((37)-N1)-methyltransferase TrmD [Pseudomonadota bacterium]
MKFTFITLFDPPIHSYFGESIMARAIKSNLLSINTINPRDYTTNKWRKVDNYAVGGGAGLTLSCEPMFACLNAHKNQFDRIIFSTPAAKPFRQSDAKRLANYKSIAFVSGRYEGFDERIIEEFADEVFCVGDFIVSGGELPSMMMADAIARQVPGVLGNEESLITESFEKPLLEAPTFSKPYDFATPPPKEFIGGNHAKIEKLKYELSKAKTAYFRPDFQN